MISTFIGVSLTEIEGEGKGDWNVNGDGCAVRVGVGKREGGVMVDEVA
ncbi:MAG TPA: hypothetical protein VEC93_08060 [Anaerolineae bacterium]|nr:hypothetical protein [Anaerolineae bacterium]